MPADTSVRNLRPRGLTVLELIVTLSIVAVLTGVAVPSVTNMWLDSKRATAVNGMSHSLQLARALAIMRGQMVSVCRSPDGQTCSNHTADWQRGWITFVNLDRDEPPIRDENEQVLAVQPAWSAGTITSNRRGYSFRPSEHGVINGTLVFCDRRGSAHARAIIISTSGRPRVAARDSDNRPLRCPNG
jgi:type IV fimbrial biogenesis protein FimT